MVQVPTRTLGVGATRPLVVSAVGLGCMGFSHGYGPGPDWDEAVDLIRRAHAMGYTFFDTAEGYGGGHNERLVGEAVGPFRSKIVLATKLHIPEATDDSRVKTDLYGVVREHLEASLERLGTDYVDLYYQHRMNRTITPEAVAEAMGRLLDEGLIYGWGQSQSTPEEIKRAYGACPLTAVQSEYSMMERMFESEVIPLCGQLGIGFVAFSPMGAGFLSGKYAPREQSEYVGDDVRRGITRFDKQNMEANQPLLELLEQVAVKKGATKAQIALAWMLDRHNYVVPIPGARKLDRLQENLGAAVVNLSAAELDELDSALATIEIHGNRTDEDILALYANQETNPTKLTE